MTEKPTPIGVDALAASVMARCDRLATHTEEPGRMTRRYLTPPVHAVHDDLTRWMNDAGMAVRLDAAGNLVGRLCAAPHGDSNALDSQSHGGSEAHKKTGAAKDGSPLKGGFTPPPSPEGFGDSEGSPGDSPGQGRGGSGGSSGGVLLIGSHLDTVPNGGKYDGILGVLLGLAVAEALRDEALPFALDVIGFSEEEGVRFSKPYFGSAAVAGAFDPQWLELRDGEGVTVRSAIEAFGLDPEQIGQAAYPPDRVLGFIEAHIEQGPVLKRAGQAVGVVTAIVGQSRLMLRFTGQPGHAGTTPMFPRQDALVSAAKLIREVQEYGVSIEGLRATVGHLQAHPNTRNVIPGQVELSLDIRHAVDEVREAAVEALLDTARRIAEDDGVSVSVLDHQTQPAAAMNSSLSGVLTEAMGDAGHEPFELLSGAGHDAVALAPAFPVGMIFLRQPKGISHHPDERVGQADVAVAIDVLTCAVRRLAQQVTTI